MRAVVHPAVSDQRQVLNPKAPLNLLNLSSHRRRVPGVAAKHLHGHRTAVGGAKQPDLLLPLLFVSVVIEESQRAALSLHVA